jgi:amidase
MAGDARLDMHLLLALTIARMIRAREASCAEVVEAHLRRIDALNAGLGAIVQLDADRARETAAHWDR